MLMPGSKPVFDDDCNVVYVTDYYTHGKDISMESCNGI